MAAQWLNPIALYQWAVDKALSPAPPRPDSQLGRPRIAVIGAGISGIAAASHIVGHGFDVAIFEQDEQVGGIWRRVNDSSGLQIHALTYRFAPSVQWRHEYPGRDEILGQAEQLWMRYGLDRKTMFGFTVECVYQDKEGKWIVNDESNGRYDGLVVAVGTCGRPKTVPFDGLADFEGAVLHSSELTGHSPCGKKVAIIGGGASAVEAMEWAVGGSAAKVTVVSRSDKWIIPRNLVVDVLLSFNIFGRETSLSWIPELLLRRLFYRGLDDLVPAQGIFTDTPMVNSEIMTKLRRGEAEWVRGDIVHLEHDGVLVNRRVRGVPKNGPGQQCLVEADVVVMATGFHRPSISFLPADCFADPYAPPNWYLQTFPPAHPSVCAINCVYLSAIGSVGNWHIGIYTRILLMMLLDPLTRPSPYWMKRWIDTTRLMKRNAPTGAFDFFTYLELVFWLVTCVVVNPFRWKWAVFVFLGVGAGGPGAVVRREEKWLKGRGYKMTDEGTSF
ncbi:hypothetical protein CDD82_6554 [Ophiocordyceps australis]|uniref:FAD/NAD(P)-binding domain-containing protein n=1 Tax=Ophiocordyceps australis TaxID=1399860 RepID=A0A2C5XZR2_9HYPO|nr:hypothetical protein CDD82_6554 [Ophiocordyceps australis]